MEQFKCVTLNRIQDYTLKWTDKESDICIVRLPYKTLQDIIHGKEYERFSNFWEVKALPYAQHFIWKVLINKVTTKDNITKRGVNLKITFVLCVTCRLKCKSHVFYLERVEPMCKLGRPYHFHQQ